MLHFFTTPGCMLAGNLETMTLYYPYIVNGQRVFMATCWCPRSTAPVDVFVEAMETAASAQRRLHA